jgi:hypothetical protein
MKNHEIFPRLCHVMSHYVELSQIMSKRNRGDCIKASKQLVQACCVYVCARYHLFLYHTAPPSSSTNWQAW